MDDFHCNPEAKPELKKNCTNEEKCTGTYFTSAWSKCSKEWACFWLFYGSQLILRAFQPLFFSFQSSSSFPVVRFQRDIWEKTWWEAGFVGFAWCTNYSNFFQMWWRKTNAYGHLFELWQATSSGTLWRKRKTRRRAKLPHWTMSQSVFTVF